MDLISPQQFMALDRYLDAVANYAQNLHILDLYRRTPLADLAGWQEDKVKSAQSHMASEEAKVNAACAGNFKALFPDTFTGPLLSRKMGSGL